MPVFKKPLQFILIKNDAVAGTLFKLNAFIDSDKAANATIK